MGQRRQKDEIRQLLEWTGARFNLDERGILRSNFLGKGLNALHLELLDHGYFYGDEAWNQFDVINPYARLYFMTKDHGWIETEGGRIDLERGKMYLIPPYVRINLRTEQTIEKLYLHLNAFYAGLNLLDTLKQCLVLDLSEQELSELLTLYEGQDLANLLQFKGKVYVAVSRFLEAYLPNLHEKILIAERYHAIHDYIAKNLRFDLSYRDVAKAFQWSPDVLRVRYQQDTGMTLAHYIHDQLIQAATLLLLNTDQHIKTIANQLGFSDEYYFSRFFKKRMQYAPRAYRKINGSGEVRWPKLTEQAKPKGSES